MDDVKYPFDDWYLNIDDISVYVDESSLLNGDVTIIDHLSAIPAERVRTLQTNIHNVATQLQYSDIDSPISTQAKDAFDLAMLEALERVFPTRPHPPPPQRYWPVHPDDLARARTSSPSDL
jgi:hypothetical protein